MKPSPLPLHLETVHRATVVFDVPLDVEPKVWARAAALSSSAVDVETVGASPCSFPYVVFEGPSRAATARAAAVFARYVLRFKGARLDP